MIKCLLTGLALIFIVPFTASEVIAPLFSAFFDFVDDLLEPMPTWFKFSFYMSLWYLAMIPILIWANKPDNEPERSGD